MFTVRQLRNYIRQYKSRILSGYLYISDALPPKDELLSKGVDLKSWCQWSSWKKKEKRRLYYKEVLIKGSLWHWKVGNIRFSGIVIIENKKRKRPIFLVRRNRELMKNLRIIKLVIIHRTTQSVLTCEILIWPT